MFWDPGGVGDGHFLDLFVTVLRGFSGALLFLVTLIYFLLTTTGWLAINSRVPLWFTAQAIHTVVHVWPVVLNRLSGSSISICWASCGLYSCSYHWFFLCTCISLLFLVSMCNLLLVVQPEKLAWVLLCPSGSHERLQLSVAMVLSKLCLCLGVTEDFGTMGCRTIWD